MVTIDYTQLGQTWRLRLERESVDMWIVVDDDADPGAVMIRTPSCDTAVRFMEAFVERTPGASMQSDADTHYSWRVDPEPAWEAAQDATAHDRLTNVYRIRPHEQLDETA